LTDVMNVAFVVGTAGSGKSSLTGVFSEWLRDHEQMTATVNLDPAAIALPYEPDLDVREYVDYERVMATKNLGPNGALIASVREVARNIGRACRRCQGVEGRLASRRHTWAA
jgi:GTPase SAR1 family protein